MRHPRRQRLNRLRAKGALRSQRVVPVSFELWNTSTRNLHGSYTSPSEAMEAMRAIAGTHGSEFAREFVLAAEDARGETTRLAAGAELVQMACQEGPAGAATQETAGTQADVA